MCHSITADQLSDWEAFDRMSPIGGERMDYGLGLIVSAITSQWREPHARIPLPREYFPWNNRHLSAQVIELPVDEQIAMFDRMVG